MTDTTLFSLGIIIFSTYMFFLLRMINRQHKAQERKGRPIVEDDKKNKTLKKM